MAPKLSAEAEGTRKQVYVVTWCNRVDNLYGTTLTFKTLRVGFPNARVHVIDNASLPVCRCAIRQCAESCGAVFTQLDRAIEHHEIIERTLKLQAEGTVIFLDPDLCFWTNVESWNFAELVAGRRIPKFACELTGCITHPRLHTSFLWIPDVEALRRAILALRTRYFNFEPFRPVMFKLEGAWHRYDAAAILFSALEDQVHPFTDDELAAYDHLFCGTHFDVVAPTLGGRYADLFRRMHNQVQRDPLTLKGAWRMQQEYFESRRVD
jgi:hypothetical protein